MDGAFLLTLGDHAVRPNKVRAIRAKLPSVLEALKLPIKTKLNPNAFVN
jgi:hypothetical protein